MKADFENAFRNSTSRWWQFTGVFFITLVLCIGAYTQSTVFKKADNFFYDFLFQTTATGNVSSRVTIIDIDETSLSAVGQWPWPRYLLAKLVKELSGNHPVAMGLDILFSEPDRNSLKNIQLQFQKDFALDLGFTGVPPALQDNDLYLAHIFRQTDIVGARYFYFDHFNKKSPPLRVPFDVVDQSGRLNVNQAEGILTNTPEIEKALKYTGFLNNQSDMDGLLRSTPLLIALKDQTFTNLSLSTFLKAHNIKKLEVLENFFGLYIKADKYKIPITQDGYINIRFTGPGRAHKFISAYDVLNQKYSPADIQGKILFIGSSAMGLNDIHHTVFDPSYPGVETHAAILSSIFENHQVIKPIWSNVFISGVCLFSGILMMLLLFFSFSPMVLLTGTFVWCSILLISSLLCFIKMSVFVSPVLPLILTVFTFGFISFVRYITARKASFTWFKKLSQAQQITIKNIVSLVETRDPETGQHIVRTQNYAKALAVHLKESGLFPDILTNDYIKTLYHASPLHDIGKVGIPDRILLKPGKLTDEEFEIMKTHSHIGRDTLQRSGRNDRDNYFLKMGAQIAGSHHERWDGKGYPDGLCGETIPLCGRIMAICDVYDALISERCYKPAFSHEEAMSIILAGRETIFDPQFVDGFFAVENTIKLISAKYKDLK
ncbi:CHASE2 domain-containing protein [Desulfobacter curvatus]|uniref:CHASE2 domain-containing protein n=1 Tax=Desulfobacter curvatus TaxID=2290 RepID=UPI00037D99CE|nr:CHASE2 domain-containing protein [Desulfobacter curvatus]